MWRSNCYFLDLDSDASAFLISGEVYVTFFTSLEATTSFLGSRASCLTFSADSFCSVASIGVISGFGKSTKIFFGNSIISGLSTESLDYDI